MKILHVISGLQYGGAENLLFQLLQTAELSEFQHKVISLTGLGPVGIVMQERGIDVISIDLAPNKIRLKSIREFLKTVRDFEPDILQTWLYHADLAGALLHLLGNKVPLIWSVHHAAKDLRNFKPATRLVVHLNRILSRWIPERIICCSQSVFDVHLQSGYPKDRMLIIPNGVDCTRFLPNAQQYTALREELGLPQTTLLVGFGGRWIPSKGHRILIRAASTLVDRYPDLHFLLWGPGIEPQNEALVAMLQENNLLDRFHLIGATAEVEKCLQGVDIYASPSLDEALPMSVAEAMACGVPCMVTDVGDQGKLVQQTGVIVQPDDEEAIVQGITILLDVEETQRKDKGNYARQRILQNYSIDQTANRYARLFRELAEQ